MGHDQRAVTRRHPALTGHPRGPRGRSAADIGLAEKDWPAVTRGIKAVYQAPTVAAAGIAFADYADTWRTRYPAMVAMVGTLLK